MSSHNTAESSMKDETNIQQFYKNKSIFLTGATGFLGKVIMEKLLRCCDVANIYVLIRSKKDKTIEQRCEAIFDDVVFERLKQENPKFQHKIVPLFGDCMLPGLGINDADRESLKKNVNIVFHVAATVRFDEKLRLALKVNVSATREILLLAREIPNLKALVHVSTAYANSNRFDIDEKIYKMTPTGQHMCQLAETLDEDTFDIIGPLIMRAWPNTYVYTKCLAEELVQDLGAGLPITIFRPAMVVATYKEPIPGWIDNMYGPTGIMVGVGTGLVRILYLTKENDAEAVPVDMCVNSLLASAWDVAVSPPYPTPPVYNYVASTQNPLSWQQYIDLGLAQGNESPILQAIWYYCFTTTSNRFVAYVLTFFYHTVPASLVDGCLIVIGKKPRLLKMYKKIHKFCQLIGYFTTQKWTFTNDNVQNLWRKLDANDQNLFFFNMSDVDWPVAIRAGVYGMRRYLLKEDPSTLPQAIVRAKRLKVIHYITVYTLYAIVLILLYYILKACFV